MEKDSFARALEHFTAGQPARRILLAPSRSVGQRLLARAARCGTPVAGVTVHSPFTLAMELCADATVGPEGLQLLTRLQTEEIVRQSLRRHPVPGAGHLQGLDAARAVWRQMENDALACRELSGADLLAPVRRDVADTLAQNRQLTRPALYRLAIERLRQGAVRLPAAAFARLDCTRLAPLEQALWDALTGGRETVLPLPGGTVAELAARLKPRCRFVACRGTENEIRWVLHDLARRGIAPDSAAVAVPSAAAALQLWQEGRRTGLAVAVDGGIPLSGSAPASLLRGLDAWQRRGYEAETLLDLLGYPGFAVPHAALLARQLRRQLIAWGRDRYKLLWTPREQDPEAMTGIRPAWEAFFARLFAALTPGEGQKQALTDLLAESFFARDDASAAALAQVRALLQQLTPRPDADLLADLLTALDDSRYLGGGPGPGALFCAGFAQCLGCGAEVLYVMGLSAAELLSPPQPLPFGGEPALPEEPLTDALQRLLFSAEGEVVLLRPSYTVEDLLEQPPALLYAQLREDCGAREETFGFAALPGLPAARPPVPLVPAEADQPAAARAFPDFAAWLVETPLSASALEIAIQCPYRFMLQYVLRIPADQPFPLPRTRWLEANELGTLVHSVLQAWFDPKAAPAPDAETLLRQQIDARRESYPPAADALVQKDIRKARALVAAGLRTLPAGHAVLATELSFGGRETPLTVQVGAYTLSVSGSIDRLDRLPDGTLAIVDYKTGDLGKYRDHPEHHVQPLLYALAAEALQNRPGAVQSARYEGLADGSKVEAPLTGPDRDRAVRQLEAFLTYLCDTADDPACDPCLQWKEDHWEPAVEEASRVSSAGCFYCPYHGFCPAKGG